MAAAYDPRADAWQVLPAPPPSRLPNIAGAARPPALHWAGDEVVLVDAWAAYSPRTERWRDLPAPPAGAATIEQTQAVTVAGRQMWLLGAAGATYRLHLDANRWATLPAPPTVVANALADAVAVGDEVYFAGEDNVVRRLSGDDWKTVHLGPEGGGCVPEGLLVRGHPAFRLCHGIVSSSSGRWQNISSALKCCYRTLVSSGTELFLWDSNDDVMNDPSAPRKAFQSWTPA
jgi:hypothetical protein